MRLLTWLGRHNPITPATRRNRHQLSLTTLESRDVPAAKWYTVHLDSPPQGTVGQIAASITSGSLHVDSSYDPDGDGTALVYADSASDAIRTALTGGVVVNLSAVSLPPATYTFTEGTSSPSTSNHAAFAVTPTAASSTWKVYLEDLTASPTVSDWDYNDFFWTVTVGDWVLAPNGSPTANPDVAVTSLNTSVTFDVLANDTDPNDDTLTVTGAGAGGVTTHGTVAVAADGGSLVYTPNAGFSGPDTFSYTISDGRGGTATGSVSVTAYAAPVVTVTGSRDTIYPDASQPSAEVPFTLNWVGTPPYGPAEIRYQVTVLDGAGFDHVATQEMFTVTLAPGQASFDSTFTLANADAERRVRIDVLAPANSAAVNYVTDVALSTLLLSVGAPVNQARTYSDAAATTDTSKELIVTYRAGPGPLATLPVVATHTYYPLTTWNVVGMAKPFGVATHSRVSLTNQYALITNLGQVITSDPVGLSPAWMIAVT